MRAIIFFGCFLVVAGSAWAQVEGDRWQRVRPLQLNPPGYNSGQLRGPSTAESLQGFDAWFQQQRGQQRQQHERYQQEARQHELNQMNRLREYDRLRQGPRGPGQPY
jgi:hypothetical protein